MPTLLERRRIEAEYAKAVYQELVAEIGADAAYGVIGRIARRLALQAGETFAERDGQTNLATFAELIAMWQEGGALEIEWHEKNEAELRFDVVRCRYAEMYEDLGIRHLGSALSCNRDGSLCEGYDRRIRMERDTTIMEGDACCNFRFVLETE